MPPTETETWQERRARDRSEGILLRRRQRQQVEEDRRRDREQNGFDIAAALELHLEQCTTRRAMLALLESWLSEARDKALPEHDEAYVQAVEHAIGVMKSSPDPLTAIAVLQRQ